MRNRRTELPNAAHSHHELAIGTLFDQSLKECGRTRPSGQFDPAADEWDCWIRLGHFLAERMRHLLQERGSAYDEVNAVVALLVSPDSLVPSTGPQRASALAQARQSEEFKALVELFKRVKNISKDVSFSAGWPALVEYAKESHDKAERELVGQVVANASDIENAERRGDYVGALRRIAAFKPHVASYFDDVMVMAEDANVRDKRLQIMAGLRDLVLVIADISEIVPKDDTVKHSWPHGRQA